MKQLKYLIIFSLLFSLNHPSSYAQVFTHGFNYQAVARDMNGNPLVKQGIVVEVSIRSGSASGNIVWQEGDNLTTNDFGLFTLVIGEGINTGVGTLSSFNDIGWGNNDYYLQIRMDYGNGLVNMGTSRFNYVPYAKIADSVRTSTSFFAAGDVTGPVSNLTVKGIQGNKVASGIPVDGQILKWNGSSSTWELSTDLNNTYLAGNGLTLSSDTFINTAPNATHTGDATGAGALTVVALQGYAISNSLPLSGQALIWNGSAWTPTSINSGAYNAGTGLSLSKDTFSVLPHTGDVIGQTELTVIALQGSPVSAAPPAYGQTLIWNGSAWSPALGGTIIGSGAANLVTFWTASSTLSSDTNFFWDNTNKRLGIGTTLPMQQLDINGNINLQNSTATSGNIYKGMNTFIHNYGTNNMFAGINAGNLTSTGTDNTGIGYQVLLYNTSATDNSALGSGALYNNTTGSFNTAMGYYALYNNISGEGNTAVGYMTMDSNITGRDNTAIGYTALSNSTSAWQNTAIGYAALFSNSTGYYNTAIGVNAIIGNTTGQYNTAVGADALAGNISTSPGYNTAMGSYALYSNTTGSYNTGLGTNTDVNPTNISNATAIGYGAIVNASNKVRIGNNAVTVIEGQVGFSSPSDKRFKHNIKDIDVGLDFVMKLRPVLYNTKTGDTRLNYGFIAQELLQLVGENNTLVNIGSDTGKTLSVRHSDLLAPVVKAIQEQQAIILNQQKQIDALIKENQQSKLENQQIKQLLIKKGIME